MALQQYTPKEYYNSKNHGYYQFITLDDIVANFMVSQVGDDKIIKQAKRLEVGLIKNVQSPLTFQISSFTNSSIVTATFKLFV